MAFYEGIDEEIYEGGDHYVPMAQFRLNKNYTPTPVTPEIIPTSTSYGIPTIYPYSGGGGDDYKGGGLFGNLDLSKQKTFTKDVWSEWGPGKGGWKTQEVTGYLNPTSGHYQTFEGKNINHLGIEVPTIAGALLDKNFGKGPQVGDIKGTFTEGWDSGVENIKEGWDEEKEKWSEIIGKAKTFFKGKKKQDDFISTAVDTEDNQPGNVTTTNQNQTGGSGDGGGSKFAGDSGAKAGTTGSWSPGGTYSAPEKSGYQQSKGSHHYADGGRIYLNYGGLASILGREGLAPGGPAGGASAGGNYGGNVNPEQEYAGRTFEERYGGGNNQSNTTVIPKTNYIEIEPELLREDPYINFSAMTPLQIAKIKGAVGFENILENDDLYAKGDLALNLGPVTTNTELTSDDGVGNTTFNLGNASLTIDPNKNIQKIGYNTSRDGINYGINYADGNTLFNIGTTFKNGGLASIL